MTPAATSSMESTLQALVIPLLLFLLLLLAGLFIWFFQMLLATSPRSTGLGRFFDERFRRGSPDRLRGHFAFWLIGGVVLLICGPAIAAVTAEGALIAVLGWSCTAIGLVVCALAIAGLWTLRRAGK